ncbi:MFS transporter [Lactobacillaceae bacterium Melli_B4]
MKNKSVLLVNMLINMGICFLMPITTLYIHNDLNKSLVVAGYVLLGFSGATAIGNIIGGRLFDRWKVKPLMYISGLGTAITLGILSIIPTWPVYPILLSIYGLFLGLLNAANNSYIAVLHKNDANIFNNGYWAANIGVGLSTFLSGILYSIDIKLVFISSTLMFLLTIMIIKFKYFALDNSKQGDATSKSVNRINYRTLLSVIIISVAMIVIWIGYEQWNSNVSVLMTNDGISVKKYSLLFTISTIEIIVLQPLIVKMFKMKFNSDRLRVILGVVLFALSYLIIIDTGSYWRFVIGVTFISIGDMLALTAVPSLLNRYANDYNRGTIQSIGSLSGAIGRALGPLTGGYLITLLNYNLTFLVLFAIHLMIAFLILVLKPNHVK